MWNWLWSLPCPKKIQIFLWKAFRDRLPTKSFLTHRRQHMDSLCPRCQSHETTLHILRDCPWAREIWSQAPGILPISFFALPLQDWLHENANSERTTHPHLIPSAFYEFSTTATIFVFHLFLMIIFHHMGLESDIVRRLYI